MADNSVNLKVNGEDKADAIRKAKALKGLAEGLPTEILERLCKFGLPMFQDEENRDMILSFLAPE